MSSIARWARLAAPFFRHSPVKLKRRTPDLPDRRLDKLLFEAGQQCLKRLYLDAHAPASQVTDGRRQAMSEVGEELLRLARSAFPRHVDVEAGEVDEQAARTAELLASEGTAVVFGATFVANRMVIRTDIVLRRQNGELDVYEVKSGTKVKPRYVADLALQVHTIEAAGHKVRAAFVLHLDHRYQHTAGAELLPQHVLRSADVSERVRRVLPSIADQIVRFQRQVDDDSVLELPTGTFCTAPFPCPHLQSCARSEPQFPLRELVDLTRAQEHELHLEGIADLEQLDPKRPGLTFRQRRLLQSIKQRSLIVEPFVRDELRQVEHPLNFLAVVDHLEALPRFQGQRPWRQIPYAFAIATQHESGRVDLCSFAFTERTDPRAEFVRNLAKQVEVGGTILCWGHELLGSVRSMLEDHPVDKPAIRAVLARPYLDMRRLFESGVFHPAQHGSYRLTDMARILIEDCSADDLAIADDAAAFAALQKAWTPRVRSATRERIGTDLRAWVEWQSRMLLALYQKFAEPDRKPAPAPAPARASAPRKPLPPA